MSITLDDRLDAMSRSKHNHLEPADYADALGQGVLEFLSCDGKKIEDWSHEDAAIAAALATAYAGLAQAEAITKTTEERPDTTTSLDDIAEAVDGLGGAFDSIAYWAQPIRVRAVAFVSRRLDSLRGLGACRLHRKGCAR